MYGKCQICGKACEIKVHRTLIMCRKHETLTCCVEDYNKAISELKNAIIDNPMVELGVKVIRIFRKIRGKEN